MYLSEISAISPHSLSRVPQVSFQFQIRIVFFGAAARTGSDDDENVASSSLKPTEWTGYWRSIHEIDRNQQFARFSRSQPAKHVPAEMTILCVRQFFCLRFSLYRLLPDRHTGVDFSYRMRIGICTTKETGSHFEVMTIRAKLRHIYGVLSWINFCEYICSKILVLMIII